jgi:hypothetical protein
MPGSRIEPAAPGAGYSAKGTLDGHRRRGDRSGPPVHLDQRAHRRPDVRPHPNRPSMPVRCCAGTLRHAPTEPTRTPRVDHQFAGCAARPNEEHGRPMRRGFPSSHHLGEARCRPRCGERCRCLARDQPAVADAEHPARPRSDAGRRCLAPELRNSSAAEPQRPHRAGCCDVSAPGTQSRLERRDPGDPRRTPGGDDPAPRACLSSDDAPAWPTMTR